MKYTLIHSFIQNARVNQKLLIRTTQCYLRIKQPEVYITNKQYEEPLEQRKAHIVLGMRTYSEATKFRKKIVSLVIAT